MSSGPHAAPDRITLTTREIGVAALLTVEGELSLRTARRLRSVLEKLLADRGRVLVDLTGMVVGWAPALDAFPLALASMSGWPAARLVLFGAGAHTARALCATPYLVAAVHVAETEAAAVRLLEVRPRRLSRRTELDCEPEAAKWARAVVETVCRDWGVEGAAASSARIVASELVTNAVVHARTSSVLTVTRSAVELRVAVRDYDSDSTPLPSDARIREARGLGLVVVGGVSRSWGVTPHLDGKTVWALVPGDDG